MEKNSKLGTVLIVIGAALNFTAFFVGVNAGGVILMALAISLVGYGAGSIMDTPCNQMKK
jgi:hypothetical protein